MTRRRVVVTGMGIVAPVGIGVDAAWADIVAGKSGITRITRFDASTFPSQIAGEVKGFDVSKWLSAKEARRYDTFIHYGLVASMEAIAHAKLDGYTGDKERVGVCIGSGIGGLPMIEETQKAYAQGGVRKISPFFVPGSIINMIAGLVSIHYGYKGPNLGTVSACSTANHSFGEAARLIEYGDADVMVAGGSEATVSPLGVGGFCAARALSTATTIRDGQPSMGRRPRRLRAGRGRRRAGAGGAGARQGARGAHLLRACGLRHERRRASHHGAAGRRRRRAPQHGQRAAQRRHDGDRHRLHQRAWHVDAARRLAECTAGNRHVPRLRAGSACRRPSR
jgi:3-oxoacyl-(acyl-carrier-protein) synthase